MSLIDILVIILKLFIIISGLLTAYLIKKYQSDLRVKKIKLVIGILTWGTITFAIISYLNKPYIVDYISDWQAPTVIAVNINTQVKFSILILLFTFPILISIKKLTLYKKDILLVYFPLIISLILYILMSHYRTIYQNLHG